MIGAFWDFLTSPWVVLAWICVVVVGLLFIAGARRKPEGS